MTTVGQILIQARNHKKLTLEQVEKATKIRLKFLAALEKDEFDKLPPGTFTKGFIKNYASYLGLPAEETLAFYRRQVNEEKTPIPSQKMENKLPFFSKLTFTTLVTIILIALFFLYLTISYLRYAGSPTLTVNAPNNNLVVASEKVEIKGKTDPDAKLSINNQVVAMAEDGSFSQTVTLLPGLNTITITATNRFQRQTTVTRNLRLEK